MIRPKVLLHTAEKCCSLLVGIEIFNETRDPYLSEPMFDVSIMNADFSAARFLLV